MMEERAHARQVVVTTAGRRDIYCVVQQLPANSVSCYAHVAQLPRRRCTALNSVFRGNETSF